MTTTDEGTLTAIECEELSAMLAKRLEEHIARKYASERKPVVWIAIGDGVLVEATTRAPRAALRALDVELAPVNAALSRYYGRPVHVGGWVLTGEFPPAMAPIHEGAHR